MRKRTKKFDLLYLFQPEDSTLSAFDAQPVSALTHICKSALWISVSFLMAAGISQLQ